MLEKRNIPQTLHGGTTVRNSFAGMVFKYFILKQRYWMEFGDKNLGKLDGSNFVPDSSFNMDKASRIELNDLILQILIWLCCWDNGVL